MQIFDNAIYTNQLDIQKLHKDLDTLKSRYAKSIIFAYKSRSGYEYLSFYFQPIVLMTPLSVLLI